MGNPYCSCKADALAQVNGPRELRWAVGVLQLHLEGLRQFPTEPSRCDGLDQVQATALQPHHPMENPCCSCKLGSQPHPMENPTAAASLANSRTLWRTLLQLQAWLTAAPPIENPYCSCKL